MEPRIGLWAVTLEGRIVLNKEMKRHIGIQKLIEHAGIERVKAELEERNRMFRGGPFAVAEAYRNWRDLSRAEVAKMLAG